MATVFIVVMRAYEEDKEEKEWSKEKFFRNIQDIIF